MRASELRVGNLLDTKEHKNVVVSAIDSVDSEIGYYWRLHYFGYWKINTFQPISLTEEWLLKFGFKKYVSDDIDIDIDFQISFHKKSYEGLIVQLFMDSNGVIFFSHSGISLFSVHHLQNLYFSLTGEELKQEEQ